MDNQESLIKRRAKPRAFLKHHADKRHKQEDLFLIGKNNKVGDIIFGDQSKLRYQQSKDTYGAHRSKAVLNDLTHLTDVQDFKHAPFIGLTQSSGHQAKQGHFLSHHNETFDGYVGSHLDGNHMRSDSPPRAATAANKVHRRVQSMNVQPNDFLDSRVPSKALLIDKDEQQIKVISDRVDVAIQAFEKYKQGHLQRLNTFQKQIKFEPKNQIQVKLEEKTNKEIQLLKRVREINTESYHNRIKTGGSLIDLTKFTKFQDPNEFLKSNNKFLSEQRQTNEEVKRDRFNDYFRHKPKYPVQVQSFKTSARNNLKKTSQTRDIVDQIREKEQQMIQSQKRGKEDYQSEQTKSNLNLKKLRRQSSGDLRQLRQDEIKGMVICLPVILADNPQDKTCADSLFFKGSNFIHKHEFRKAVQTLESTDDYIFIQETLKQKEMIKFNLAYSYYKLDERSVALKIWNSISFYQFQILSKFNSSIIHLLEERYIEAFSDFEECMQQVMTGFMNCEWISTEQFHVKCRKVFAFLKKNVQDILKTLAETDETQKKIKSQIEQINLYITEVFRKVRTTQDTVLPTNRLQSRAQSATSNISQSEKAFIYSNLPESAKPIKRLQSQSMTSDYDQFSSQASPKKGRLGNIAASNDHPKGSYSFSGDNEYFPIPFEASKRIQVQSQQGLRTRAKFKSDLLEQSKQEVLRGLINESRLLNQPDQLDQHVQDISFISKEGLEKLVFREYNNSQIPDSNQKAVPQRLSIIEVRKQSRLHRHRSVFTEQQQQCQEVLKQSFINMELIDNEISQLDQPIVDIYESQIDQPSTSQNLVSQDEYGFSCVLPLYLDKDKDVVLDRIIGLKQGQALNEHEKDIVEKRKQIEKEYMIDRVLDQLENENNIEVEENGNTQSNDFLIENFFKVYDRDPQPNADESEVPAEKQGDHRRNKSVISSFQQSEKCQKKKTMQQKRNSEGGGGSKPRVQNVFEYDDDNPVYKRKLREIEADLILTYMKEREENPSGYLKIDKYLKKLDFFAKYNQDIRSQLFSELTIKEYDCGETIFNQGEASPFFFVLIRGSVKAILIKKDYGNIPIVINTYYDGREFGEVNLYEVSDNLTLDMVKQLNKQKYTCETMEKCYVAILEKEKTLKIINQNLQADFEKRIDFLKEIDIFKGMEMHVLLPLANNLRTEKYRLGEYILKEGQQPKGLYLIFSGQCKVGSEKLSMRSKTPFQFGFLQKQFKNFKFKGNFQDDQDQVKVEQIRMETRGSENEFNDSNNAMSRAYASKISQYKLKDQKRIFQNDRIYFDDDGKRIKDHIIYKDYMTFFSLTSKDYFGGKVLLVSDSNSLINYYLESEQREENKSTRQKDENDDHSLLSVIADSCDVELLIMDRTQLSFFPEKIQKEIYHRIESAFQPDKPYEMTVVQKIKDKFREWEKYKLETVTSILKQSYAEKKKTQILNLNR